MKIREAELVCHGWFGRKTIFELHDFEMNVDFKIHKTTGKISGNYTKVGVNLCNRRH